MAEVRRGFTAGEKAALWEGWKSGLSLLESGRALDRRACTIFRVVRREGGFAPAPRHRAGRCLQSIEREEITRDLAAGLSIQAIARKLGRSASTISREIRRNGGKLQYRAAQADARAWKQAQRPQPCLLARRPRLKKWVAGKLQRDWSPRQIAV